MVRTLCYHPSQEKTGAISFAMFEEKIHSPAVQAAPTVDLTAPALNPKALNLGSIKSSNCSFTATIVTTTLFAICSSQ